MFPSTPPETGRNRRPDGPPGPAGPPPGRDPRGYPGGPGGYGEQQSRRPPGQPGRADPRIPVRDEAWTPSRDDPRQPGPDDPGPDGDPEVDVVPVNRALSLSVAGFAALLGAGLVLGVHTAGPGHRLPFTVVVFGVQLLYILAWTMAMRPPALPLVAGISVAVAAAADAAATRPALAVLAPLGYVAVGGFVLAVLGQLVRRADRTRVTESLGATLLVVVGVVAFGTLIVLSRKPGGTQAIFVCLTAVGVALAVARLVDALLPRPRLAPQVPRGAAGVVAGAMCGTLASAVVGSYLVAFKPTGAALVGLVAAGTAVLADLAVGYAEAGRQMAGDAPTMWIARHMQGPLGGFALAAPAAYAVTVFWL